MNIRSNIILRRLGRPLLRLAREEDGVALVFTIAVFLFLFVLILSVYSVGETIRRKTELQNACDAAAYSAAVVQADALSRMAVVNRAMSWSYIQMTKAELDYYTYLWLEHLLANFKHDSEVCLKISKGEIPPFNKKCGWWHSKNTTAAKLLKGVIFVIPLPPQVFTFGLDCHEHYHDNPDNHDIRWIGLGPGSEEFNRIRIGYTYGGQLEYRNGDLCIPTDQNPIPLVSTLRQQFGEHGTSLRTVIDRYQMDIVCCNLLLSDIAAKMTNAIPETVRRTLLENLPRTASGELDESILDQYRWTAAGGFSPPPPEYGDETVATETDASSAALTSRSFFSGLHDTEEDELLFLNMANGLPTVRTGPSGTATLKDWFADEKSALGNIRLMAGGLDQWFIRCLPAETSDSKTLALSRQPQYAIPGIVRSYKNANYDEGRSSGSLAQNLLGKLKITCFLDVHRGNHVLPSVTDELDKKLFNPSNFSSLFSTGGSPSVKVPSRWKYGKSARKVAKRIRARVQSTWKGMQKTAVSIVTAPLSGLISPIREMLSSMLNFDVDPSCSNLQTAFADQCSRVDETYGLVADYEWKTAAWVCGWVKRNGKVTSCFHIPAPIGLAFGSNAKDPAKDGLITPWLSDQKKMFFGSTKGHTREDYRSTFIGIDTSTAFKGHRKNNQFLRGYTRIYGDDKALLPYFILDKVPARPWILNEKFFTGGGTIFVALAKEQRNVFDWIADGISGTDLHFAFSPEGTGKKPVYYVAMSAGRAGPARRTGRGRADGPDTENASLQVPRYELAWDAVTDRKLEPRFAKGDEKRRAEFKKAFAKNGYDIRVLEEEYRLGCACGGANTDRRLARQWNLSQTDWDGMLLPVRHAFSGTAGTHDTGKQSGPTDPVWAWDETGRSSDANAQGVERLFQVLRDADWNRFDEAEPSSETSDDLLDDALSLPLLRRRRVL